MRQLKAVIVRLESFGLIRCVAVLGFVVCLILHYCAEPLSGLLVQIARN